MKNRILLLALILALFTTPFTVIAEEANQAGSITDQATISDQSPSDQAPSDQAFPDQAPSDQAFPDQAPSDQSVPEQVQDNIVTTKHTALIQGKELSYTANTGTMFLETNGKTCEIFFTAYTLDDVADPADRPVTFAFNGGPGACSMFLHAGCLGPRRIDVDENGYTLSMPARMKDNNNSLLDITDIVFIDAPGTGYSQPVGTSEISDFIGYENDICTFGDFIYQYINRNGRWLSEKYVAGESYGTMRAVGICDYLAGMYSMNLNGLMLISSINDISGLMFGGSNEIPYATFIPTFAADAWYHGVIAKEYLNEVRSFVENKYVPALFKGSGLTEDEKDAIAERYAGYTGLSKEYVLSVNLRVALDDFCAELLKDQKLMVGRYDGRITGPITSGSLENGDSDPSNAAFTLGFGNSFNYYLTEELGFHTDRPYIPMSSDVNIGWAFPIDTWGGYLNQQQTVYECISKNPFLKVWVLCGYYDAATPFYSAEWVFRHVFLDEAHSGNLSFTYYPCGHMIYMEKKSFDKFRKDAEAWYSKPNSQGQ